ncbi:MAG: hypothetical protein JWM05_265 [Acidimicrobiales bacterium]|nr:hypothetical protein [Acidimicrobiales bacterium]
MTGPGGAAAARADPGVVEVERSRDLDEVADDGTAPVVPGPTAVDRRFWLLLGLLTLVALVIRVDVVRNVAPPVPALGDAHAYHVLGTNLADGRGYIRPYDFERAGRVVATAEYPPALPIVLAVATKLGAASVEDQRIVLCLLGSATVLLIGLAARRLAGPAAGLVAASIAAGYPMLWASDAALMPETLAALAAAGVLLLALRALSRPGWRSWLALGAALGASALVRSEALLLAPLLVVPMAWRVPRAGRRQRLMLAAAALGMAAAVVLPWTVRNALTFHQLVPVSNNVGSVARGANCDLAYRGQYRGLWVTDVGDLNGVGGGAGSEARRGCFAGFPIRAGVDEAAAAAALRSDGIRYARHHVGDLPAVAAARVGRTLGLYRFDQQTSFAGVEGRAVLWERRGTRLFQLLALLGIAGAVVLARRREPVWPLVAPVVTVLITAAVTYGNQRFRAAAEPAIVVLAAVPIVTAAHRATRRLTP